jgi:CheY-like chemotaxis protein
MQNLQSILYIEDDPDIQEIVKLALEQIGGFTVDICSSGSDAISLIARKQPQLVLLDVMMPGIDGLSTFRAIRSFPESRGLPVIFITAKVQKPEIEAYMKLGATGVIAKPFDAITLSDQVRGMWELHAKSGVS